MTTKYIKINGKTYEVKVSDKVSGNVMTGSMPIGNVSLNRKTKYKIVKEFPISIDDLLKCSYDKLRKLITEANPIMYKALCDERIKNKLINSESTIDFIYLIQNIPNKMAVLLFDKKGLEILKDTKNLDIKLGRMLTSKKEYLDMLFKDRDFCFIVTNNFDEVEEYFEHLSDKSAFNYLRFTRDYEPAYIKQTLFAIQKKVRLDALKNMRLPYDLLNLCIVNLGKEESEYLLNNDLRFISLTNLRFSELMKLFSKEYSISPRLLDDKDFVKKIVSIESIKDYRFLINEISKANDPSLIERLRKDYCNKTLLDFDKENNMLTKYSLCYKELCSFLDKSKDNIPYELLDAILDKYMNLYGDDGTRWHIRNDINNILVKKDKDALKEYFIRYSNVQTSNLIIDYHFEDVPYNFLLDINELVNFQKGKGRTLSDDDLKIYKLLQNIDSLTHEEKLFLHQKMSKTNWVSKHYDVLREAKDKEASLIKESMLTKDNIATFYDEKLSKEKGVPIYVLDGVEYTAFVKSLMIEKYSFIDEYDLDYRVDAASYSLDGSNKLSTYCNPRTYYNLIYRDFPIDQVVHVCSVDSFSRYIRNRKEKATDRVYELATPEELINTSLDYNEIVLAQKNDCRHDDELNETLGKPELLGIYCYDEVTSLDIESAKNLGVGIVLVKTKSYEINREGRTTMFDYMNPEFVHYEDQPTYFDNVEKSDISHRLK